MPTLPGRIVEIGYQLIQFCDPKHVEDRPLGKLVDNDTLQRAVFLTDIYPAPPSLENVRYPPDWPIDKAVLRKAVREFLKGTEYLLKEESFIYWLNNGPEHPDRENPTVPIQAARSRSVSIASSVTSIPPAGTVSGTVELETPQPIGSFPGPPTAIRSTRTRDVPETPAGGRGSSRRLFDKMTSAAGPSGARHHTEHNNDEMIATLREFMERQTRAQETFQQNLALQMADMQAQIQNIRDLNAVGGHRRGEGHQGSSRRPSGGPDDEPDDSDHGHGNGRGPPTDRGGGRGGGAPDDPPGGDPAGNGVAEPDPEYPRRDPWEQALYTGHWKTDEIGYFWPDLKEDNALRQQGHHVYYRDVNVFIDRLTDIVDTKGELMVKSNIQACLRGNALTWFTSELTDMEKRLMRNQPLEQGWFAELKRRFKANPLEALEKLKAMRYGFVDVANRRSPQSFAEEVIRHARNAEIGDQYQHIKLIYNALDPQLQRDVTRPTATTTRTEFLQELEDNQFLWQNLNDEYQRRTRRRAAASSGTPHGPKNLRRQQNGTNNRDSRPLAANFQAQNSSFRNNYGSDRRFNYQNSYQNQNSYYRPPWQANNNQGRPFNQGPNQSFVNRQANYSSSNDQRRGPQSNNGNNARQPWNQGGQNNQGSNNNRYSPGQNNQFRYRRQGQGQGQSNQGNQNSQNRYQPPYGRAYGVELTGDPSGPDQNNDNDPGPSDFDNNLGNDDNQAYYGIPNEPNYDPGDDDQSAFYQGNDFDPDAPYDEFDDGYDGYDDAYMAQVDHVEQEAPLSVHEQVDEQGDLVVATCLKCQAAFESNNALHRHLSNCFESLKPQRHVPTAYSTDAVEVVESTRLHDANDPDPRMTSIRTWRCTTASVGINDTSSFHEVCLDTGCSSTIIDEAFARKLGLTVSSVDPPITVRGIGKAKYTTTEIATFNLYFPAAEGYDGPSFAKIAVRAHLVPSVKAQLLVGTDVLVPEGIVLNFNNRCAVIESCKGFSFPLTCEARNARVTQAPVYAAQRVVVPSHSVGRIPIRTKKALPTEKDYMFRPTDATVPVYVSTHLVDDDFSFVEVRNDQPRPVTIARHARLGTVSDVETITVNAYNADGKPIAPDATNGWENVDIEPPRHKEPCPPRRLRRVAGRLAQKASQQQRAQANNRFYRRRVEKDFIRALRADASVAVDDKEDGKTTVLPNGVTVYGTDPNVVGQVKTLLDRYDIWASSSKPLGTVRIPESQWMQIPLKDGWQRRIPRARVYRLSQRDRKVVDDTFDPLVAQGKLAQAVGHTPSGFPVFVVWRWVWDEKEQCHKQKGRAVVDLRGANKEAEADFYPVPSQDEIITLVRGRRYVTVVDACKFFYQWPVRRDHRSRLAVVSHRGQEVFNVAMMGFVNSVPFVQRMMDAYLADLRAFCRAYIDDIVVASETWEEHLDHLNQLFERLQEMNVRLEPKKAFIAFPSVTLLGQRVDSFGLSTPEEKISAIRELSFPSTLGNLEHYLGLTGYFRHYIERYASITEPLQARKTSMLRGSPRSGQERKTWSNRPLEEPTKAEKDAFDKLQGCFTDPLFLCHFDPDRRLYADLDASRRGHGAMLYHVKKDYNHEDHRKPPPRTVVEPILFLSRTLTAAEMNYWPTELEVSCLVWMLRKTRHLMESSKKIPIVYTDHSSTTNIAKQTSLSTTSSDKLNLRLIRASMYVQQFRLNIYHRPGRDNVVADALSRCPTSLPTLNDVDLESVDDAFYVQNAFCTTSSIHLSEDFKDKVKNAYSNDRRASTIIDTVRQYQQEDRLADFDDIDPSLPYALDDGLLYSLRKRGAAVDKWLYIPRPLVGELFKLVHDNNDHLAFEKCLPSLEGLSIYQGRRLLKEYCLKCPTCLANKHPRHRPYDLLNPVLSPMIPFDTITMDFIVALPKTRSGNDQLLVIVDKATKRLGLLPGKMTWTAFDWGVALLDYLRSHDWAVPRKVISDRDSLFLSEFWKGLFTNLGVDWIYTTAYHHQADGQSERSVQTVETMFRHYLTANPNLDRTWENFIPSIISSVNGSPNSSTQETPHRLLFGMDFAKPWNLVRNYFRTRQDESHDDDATRDFSSRTDAEEALRYAQLLMKKRYDTRHSRFPELAQGDLVLLRLHRGYSLPTSKLPPKLSAQFAGPFKVIKKVGKGAYELELPDTYRIHPVISTSMLEPYLLEGPDSFDRQFERPDAVKDDEFPDENDRYEVERIIDKRTVRIGRGRRPYVQYFVVWKGYPIHEGSWIRENDLNAPDLVQEYERSQASERAEDPAPGNDN